MQNQEEYESRQKNYSDCLSDLSKEELFKGLLAYGMFEEKIPNFLSSENFFDFCKDKDEDFFNDTKKPSKFITYESMRNINIPREIAIPNPISYRHLCYELSKNWDELKIYFEDLTKLQTYKVSRIHIRKIENQEKIFERCYDNLRSNDIDIDTEKNNSSEMISNHIFKMNHKDFCADDYPEPILLIGSKYLVTADISNCFPSIYSHSISWALVGKNKAKENQSVSSITWFNEIDRKTRNLKDGETQGVLIGPHSSNLISEIILVNIDKRLLEKGYKFIRYIDDYSCYTKSLDEAEKFLIDLSFELRKYTLVLNHKKTKIEELPLASSSHWIRKLKRFVFLSKNDKIGLNEVRAFLDIALDLMNKNENNSSVMNYAVRILAKQNMTERAKDYFIKTIHHLVLLYPYLIQLLDEEIFNMFDIDSKEIENITLDIYEIGKEKNLYEAMSYSVFFALKYDFKLTANLYEDIEKSKDCVFMLLGFIYDKKHTNDEKLTTTYMKQYKKLANTLKHNEMDNYWLFIYEVLTEGALVGLWKKMKKESVTFIKMPSKRLDEIKKIFPNAQFPNDEFEFDEINPYEL